MLKTSYASVIRSFEPRGISRQRGVSLVEIMVGLLIGLISVAAIYQVFAVTEGQKRTTGGIGEAQQSGALASFIFGKDIFGAGAGFAPYLELFDNCPNVAGARSTKLVPVVITNGDDADPRVPDRIVITQGVSRMPSLQFKTTAPSAAADPFKAIAAIGFSPGDRVVAVAGTGAATQCEMVTLTSLGAQNPLGVRDLNHDPKTSAAAFPTGTSLISLGPEKYGGQLAYDVVNNQIRVQDLTYKDPAETGALPQPLIDHVVNMQAQYGVGTFDAATSSYKFAKWVNPEVDAATTINYGPASVKAAKADYQPTAPTALALRSIMAVRIAVVVRSTQYEKADDTSPASVTLFPQPAAADGGAPIVVNLTADERHYRYRVYETVIPMRNVVWNGTPL